MNIKKLPIGLQTFERLIKDNFTYVDKTEILYNLIIKGACRYFFSRPRRFGKSLTCSTLEAIFEGRKDLFDGFAISKTNYQWKKHPVVKIDMNGVDHDNSDEFKAALLNLLSNIAQKYDVILEQTFLLKAKFKELIFKLAEKFDSSVVVIIDEYDKPILDHINNEEMACSMREILKGFYGTLKDQEVDKNLHFLFLTGVSKFAKVSIFSELNNLEDLTLSESVATLCGYTQDELETVFGKHIEQLVEKLGCSRTVGLDKLRQWYNGYQFSEVNLKVYNPFSILNCLSNNKFSNYWFSSGTPTFLIRLVEKNPAAVNKLILLEQEHVACSDFESFSVETYFENFVTLLAQSGYLTISSYNSASDNFSLSFPNYEVRRSMTGQILKYIANLELSVFNGFVERFRSALIKDDINTFCQTLKDFFMIIPHNIVVEREKFYQGIFFSLAKLIGAQVRTEDATSQGFIDAVLEGANRAYVIEFKRDQTPDIALAQIEKKEYFAKFQIEGTRPVTLVGMAFGFKDNVVTLEWKIKEFMVRDARLKASLLTTDGKTLG